MNRYQGTGTGTSVVDPHSFLADPDPAFCLNADADPDPAPKKTFWPENSNFFIIFLHLLKKAKSSEESKQGGC